MSRTSPVIDTSKFTALLADALVAFGTDLGYATAICAKARVIEAKRATWNARTGLREATADARDACSDGPAFTCESELPCGVGPACRYATGDLATFEPVPVTLHRGSGSRPLLRPQPGPDGTHGPSDVETIVIPWRDHLAALSGPE